MTEPLDRTILADLLAKAGDDPERIGATVDGFQERAPGQLAALRRAVEAGDDLEAERLATSLEGQADTLGAIGLAQVCREVAALVRVGATADAAARLSEAEAALADLAEALDEARATDWDVE
jgi:HPt (histidine-containing phosphotransfer) domain-containing protein